MNAYRIEVRWKTKSGGQGVSHVYVEAGWPERAHLKAAERLAKQGYLATSFGMLSHLGSASDYRKIQPCKNGIL